MKVAITGNPNTGKTSLFNKLTGLNQKVGNYPGITVEKKVGYFVLPNNTKVELVDLPGTYSLNASSKDEEVVTEALINEKFQDYPEAVIVVVDATNLKRNLLLFTQVLDLELPVVLVLNMIDVANRKGLAIDAAGISNHFNVPVVCVNARKGTGLSELKEALAKPLKGAESAIFNPLEEFKQFTEEAAKILETKLNYAAWLVANTEDFENISVDQASALNNLRVKHAVNTNRSKVKETISRYRVIDEVLAKYVSKTGKGIIGRSDKLDSIVTHKIWGFLIFFGLLTIIFQAIFSWASWPMELIETFFGDISTWIKTLLPAGPVAEMLADGIVPGVAGVLVFIPQIAILFAFIALLEETGYMSRVVFIMDRLMRKFGMNGKSVVPLLSGMACAIPAVMATRGINNWKERLITILVTPFMTCSARLPVYTILIALVIPQTRVFGFISLQGLMLMALYLFGFVMAILAALVFSYILKSKRKGYLIMEMPPYKIPQGRNVAITIIEKVKSFVFTAGKIIIAISMVLWVLASYGPSNRIEKAIVEVEELSITNEWGEDKKEVKLVAARLENSYMGIFGKTIEPAIKPLGYDWKIGIALLSSFAAREVFVGTMATIYSVGDPNNELGVKAQMAKDVDPETGEPRFSLAVAISLLIFYALAMQCMSTMAVVYRETNGWKWPIIQFLYMTGLAYLLSLIAYQVLK